MEEKLTDGEFQLAIRFAERCSRRVFCFAKKRFSLRPCFPFFEKNGNGGA